MPVDPLNQEKRRADAMRRGSAHPEDWFWIGYRLALSGPHVAEDSILEWIGGDDPTFDARGRGYRAGRAWVAKFEARKRGEGR